MNTETLNALALRWQGLASGYCDDALAIEAAWLDIQTRYQEPHRAFHTLEHLQHIFLDLDDIAVDNSTAFAVWYHDIIYKPGSSKNEARSASHAAEVLSALSVPLAMSTAVQTMILATQKHSSDDATTQVFLDADMAILGAAPAQYGLYLKNLQKEFKAVPKALFKRGRRRFIMQTLAEPAIFKSESFNARYERQARENLTNEMARIQAR
ncbi:MAG: hypothetical protein HRU20_21850 [Pseudomonadales bacterium]|nr:hypothetical protein [Pseudomonadales bacterium]